MSNTALPRNHARQNALTAMQSVLVANLNVTAEAVAAVSLPYGAVVTGGFVQVKTAFDAATATLDVGDAVTADRYLADGNIAATGVRTLAPTGYVSDGAPILITPTFADAVTEGELLVVVTYVISGRASETQPN